MIYKEHLIELWVNGNKVELEDQKSLNMRFNNVLLDPTKISSNQAEYSFEFEVPATPKNNTIFDYANNLSKPNKFRPRYNAEVYADGTVIFSGTITVNGLKDSKYSVNLVSVKVYSLEEIFGDKVMTDIEGWEIPFNGVETINSINGQLSPEVTFPIVSYGVFQKYPKYKDDVGKDFTSKFDIDEWNTWYVESFSPSPNMLETLKRCFESTDSPNGEKYIVGGDAFVHPYLKEIYMSTNLADGQSPDYNVGNPRFGKVDLNLSWSTPTSGDVFTQDLRFPYFRAGGQVSNWNTLEFENERWNFSSIQLYDMLAEGSVTINNTPNYMYQPNEHIIIIPADGFYDITLTVDTRLSQSEAITALQFVRDEIAWIKIEEDREVEIPLDFVTTMPLEIQLVRNYDDNIELIKGKNNLDLPYGYSDYTLYPLYERNNWITCYPHEQLGSALGEIAFLSYPPTKGGELASTKQGFRTTASTIGYIYSDGDVMCYDPAVSQAFVCGFTTMGNDTGLGTGAVMKNGYSWSKTVSERNDALYNQKGYDIAEFEFVGDTSWATGTEFNRNEYQDAPSYFFYQDRTNNTMRGEIHCLIHFNKNDKLQLMAVQRDYSLENGESVRYTTSANVHLSIEARTPRPYGSITDSDNKYAYTSPIEFSDKLNIANFFNKEKKVSEWVKNVVDAFNLEMVQDGKHIFFNTKKKPTDAIIAVDIDDRVNSDEAQAKSINYPKSMEVKYKIDTDEWGFERSAVANYGNESILNEETKWKQWGDYGSSKILLDNESWVTSKNEQNLQFSYTWYQNFNWYATTSSFEKSSSSPVTLKIPCISKYSYMIDGYDYEESAKHDGYGLSQRFWFRPRGTSLYVWTRTYPTEQIWLYAPSNLYTNYQDIYFNLSYKNTENSLLTEFFNINAYLASNYVELDVYLSPEEYNRIKSGSLVHFDSDLYIPVEVSGYDPSGYNPTTLKLMKKVN